MLCYVESDAFGLTVHEVVLRSLQSYCVCKCFECALKCTVPEGGNTVEGGPAHDKASLRAGAALAHLLQAATHPHVTQSHLSLQLEMC